MIVIVGIALPYMDALYPVVALQAYMRGAGDICLTLGKCKHCGASVHAEFSHEKKLQHYKNT